MNMQGAAKGQDRLTVTAQTHSRVEQVEKGFVSRTIHQHRHHVVDTIGRQRRTHWTWTGRIR